MAPAMLLPLFTVAANEPKEKKGEDNKEEERKEERSSQEEDSLLSATWATISLAKELVTAANEEPTLEVATTPLLEEEEGKRKRLFPTMKTQNELTITRG